MARKQLGAAAAGATDIVAKAYVDSAVSSLATTVAHNTGDETLAGVKTFSSVIQAAGGLNLQGHQINSVDSFTDDDNNLVVDLIAASGTPVNYVAAGNAVTGSPPFVAANGSDSNIDLNLVTTGSGIVRANGVALTTISGGQTLTNKTLDNSNTLTPKDTFFTVQSWSDATKGIQLSAASISTGQVRTLTVPDASDTLVLLSLAQTLTNKTLTSPALNTPTISSPTLSGTLAGTYTIGGTPTFPSTVVLTTGAQTLASKTLSSPTFSGTVAGTYTLGGTPTFPAAVVQTTSTQTLTNKTITPRIPAITSSATPTIVVTGTDQAEITVTANITGVTVSGTPVDGQKLMVRLYGTASYTITWGSSFASTGVATLLATTVANKYHYVGFIYNAATSTFDCIAVDANGR